MPAQKWQLALAKIKARLSDPAEQMAQSLPLIQSMRSAVEAVDIAP